MGQEQSTAHTQNRRGRERAEIRRLHNPVHAGSPGKEALEESVRGSKMGVRKCIERCMDIFHVHEYRLRAKTQPQQSLRSFLFRPGLSAPVDG